MRIGEIRARGIRLMQYANLVGAVSSVLVAVKVGAYDWIWVAVVVLCFAVLALIDPQMYKGEHNYANRNNEQWQEVRKMIQDIHKERHGSTP